MIHSGRVRYHESLEPLLVDIDIVKPWRENYNNGDIDEIENSILMNGMYRPIIVDPSTREILAGNHTYAACLSLGAKSIPVVWAELNDEQHFTRIAIGDNVIASSAMPDEAALLRLVKEVLRYDEHADAEAQALSLLGTGLSRYDIAALLSLDERNRETVDGLHAGREELEHFITCPECGHRWKRGSEGDEDE